MNNCEITGEAVIRRAEPEGRVFDGTSPDYIIIWDQADPEIHISMELLKDPTARGIIQTKYKIGEICPHWPHSRHARLKTK